jgi:TetR/AcrR family transcriptional regulator
LFQAEQWVIESKIRQRNDRLMTLLVPAHHPGSEKTAGRIRQKNEELILAAAEEEFARHGFKGTSMNTIAQRVGLPKANLHYYFNNKLGLYMAVLANILELWDSTFNTLTAEDDPAEALARYIRAKMEFSRQHPLASRIFAMEIIGGGSCLYEYFNQDYQNWFRQRAAVFEDWVRQGKMDPIDPIHLIFLLWGSTQHYADFSSQICHVTGRTQLTQQDYDNATRTLTYIILKGCGLRPPAQA